MRNGKCSRKENSKQRREAGGGIEERPGDWNVAYDYDTEWSNHKIYFLVLAFASFFLC